MKKTLLLFAAIIMLAIYTVPVYAENSFSENAQQLILESVTIGNETILIPTTVITHEPPIPARNSLQTMCEELVTYYLPVTEEGKIYNDSFIEEYLSAPRASSTTTDTFLDPKNYMTSTTYIRYTISGATVDNKWVGDAMIKIANVAITKNRNPESSSSGGILWEIGNPSARVVCVGATPQGGLGTMSQETTLNLSWSSAGTNTPSCWSSVVRGEYSDHYRGLATFSFNLVYNTGTVPCRFTHTLAK